MEVQSLGHAPSADTGEMWVSYLGGGTAKSQQASGQRKDVLGIRGRLVSKWPVCHVA